MIPSVHLGSSCPVAGGGGGPACENSTGTVQTVMCNVLGGGGGGRGQWPLVAGLRLSLPVTGRPGTSQHHVLRNVNT